MPLKSSLRRQIRRLKYALPPRFGGPITFAVEDIGDIFEMYRLTSGTPGTQWDAYRHAHLRLPKWYSQGLDPWSGEYRLQQLQLWKEITGVDRPYEPQKDEASYGWEAVDAVRLPGFYMRRDHAAINVAADNTIATGMVLKHCGLAVGSNVLEYGAGFAQTSLALARLGISVDTVDIVDPALNYWTQAAYRTGSCWK